MSFRRLDAENFDMDEMEYVLKASTISASDLALSAPSDAFQEQMMLEHAQQESLKDLKQKTKEQESQSSAVGLSTPAIEEGEDEYEIYPAEQESTMSFYKALPDGANDDEEEEQVVDIKAICTTPALPSRTTAAAPLSGVPVYIQL